MRNEHGRIVAGRMYEDGRIYPRQWVPEGGEPQLEPPAEYLITAAIREEIASAVEALADNYPEDVFPPDSSTRDGISGTAMRHAYRNAARTIRET